MRGGGFGGTLGECHFLIVPQIRLEAGHGGGYGRGVGGPSCGGLGYARGLVGGKVEVLDIRYARPVGAVFAVHSGHMLFSGLGCVVGIGCQLVVPQIPVCGRRGGYARRECRIGGRCGGAIVHGEHLIDRHYAAPVLASERQRPGELAGELFAVDGYGDSEDAPPGFHYRRYGYGESGVDRAVAGL